VHHDFLAVDRGKSLALSGKASLSFCIFGAHALRERAQPDELKWRAAQRKRQNHFAESPYDGLPGP